MDYNCELNRLIAIPVNPEKDIHGVSTDDISNILGEFEKISLLDIGSECGCNLANILAKVDLKAFDYIIAFEPDSKCYNKSKCYGTLVDPLDCNIKELKILIDVHKISNIGLSIIWPYCGDISDMDLDAIKMFNPRFVIIITGFTDIDNKKDMLSGSNALWTEVILPAESGNSKVKIGDNSYHVKYHKKYSEILTETGDPIQSRLTILVKS